MIKKRKEKKNAQRRNISGYVVNRKPSPKRIKKVDVKIKQRRECRHQKEEKDTYTYMNEKYRIQCGKTNPKEKKKKLSPLSTHHVHHRYTFQPSIPRSTPKVKFLRAGTTIEINDNFHFVIHPVNSGSRKQSNSPLAIRADGGKPIRNKNFHLPCRLRPMIGHDTRQTVREAMDDGMLQGVQVGALLC